MSKSLPKWILSTLILFFSVVMFGGVDLWAQSLILLLIGFGLFFQRIRSEALPSYLWTGFGIFFAFLLAKELLPAAWFSPSIWRTSIQQDYGVVLSKTHHPVLEKFWSILALGVSVGLLGIWWRSFADIRFLRIHLSWTGFAVAVFVALLSFALKGQSIFGLRETLGYDGFGPFPNRNHSGALFVAGIFLGWGCCWEAWRHRLMLQIIASLLGMAVLGGAAICSTSRGAAAAGLIAFVIVLAIIYIRRHDFRFLVMGISLVLIGVSLVSVGRSSLMKRFQEGVGSGVTLEGRVSIWKDAVKVIQDAPILGHGVGMYESIHPFYQTYLKPNHQVHHPESTYLQLAAELGIPLTLLLGLLFLMMIVPAWDDLSGHHHQFPFKICAMGGCLVFLVHGLVDVPLLRWGDAVMAMLCWTVFTSVRLPFYDDTSRLLKRLYVVPLLGAGFLGWICLRDGLWLRQETPSKWSASRLAQKINQNPFEGAWHHELGLRLMSIPGEQERACREFRLSHRLLPSSWTLPLLAGQVVRSYSPGIALSFWSTAIERSGHRQVEIFLLGLEQTKSLSVAASYWRNYVEFHPILIPAYLEKGVATDEEFLFDQWKTARGSIKVGALLLEERNAFYQVIVHLKQLDYFQEWMSQHLEEEEVQRDFWGQVLARLGKSEQAWLLLEKGLPPLEFSPPTEGSEEVMKSEWERNPKNALNTQRWIEWLHSQGRIEERNLVLIQASKLPNALLWFRQRAARVYAEKQQFTEAVTTALGSL